MESPLDTVSRRLLQLSFVLLALFVPFSIAGASNAIGLGAVAWMLYSYSRRDRLYERVGRAADIDARHDPFLFVSLLLVLSAVPSVVMSENLGRALVDWRSYWLLLVHFLVAAHVRRVGSGRAAFWVLFASATLSCLVAFVQRSGGVDLGVFQIGAEHRAGGTLYTMTFAGILTQLVVFFVAVALGTRTGGRERLVISAGAAIQFVALVLTMTRGAWLAVIAGLLTACILIRNRAVAVAAVVLVAGLLAFTFVLGSDDGRALSITQMLNSRADRNVATRLVLWDIAWDLFTANPVTGVGMGDFESEVTAALGDRTVMTTTDAHNAYLQILATRGLVGFIPFLLFWVVLLRELFRAKGRYERGSREWGYAVGAIGGTVAVLIGALTELNIDDEEVFIAFMFLTGLARSAMYTPTRSRAERASA